MAQVVAKRTKPLCWLPSGKLVAYSRGKLLLYSDQGCVEEHTLFNSDEERILGLSKWATRLLRLGVKQSIPIDDEHIILSVKNTIYEYSFPERKLSKGFTMHERIRPLYFTEIKSIEGFDDGIVCGGYLYNMDKSPVHIYRRIGIDKWEPVFTFEKGVVNHIHNIIPDPYRKCLWIFTGDFGEAAAIWKATDNFNNVEKMVCDDQTYRACVAFALPEGLLYATDNPYFDNYIYMIKDMSTMEKIPIASLSGTCIYGCRWKDQFVFSSTVEADNYENSTLIDSLFRHRLGAGIKDEYTHLYIGHPNTGFEDVLKRKKDFLSYLFQFAVFMFPSGTNNSDALYFYPMATTENDLDLMKLIK